MKYTLTPRYNEAKESRALLTKFVSMLRNARRANHQIIVCNPPVYGQKHEVAFKRVSSVCKKLGVEVVDYDAAMFKDEQLFYDYGHLNKSGALVYSKELSDSLWRS
jgi:hypothetical protein